MTTRISFAAAAAAVQAMGALLDGGVLRIYSGAQPAGVGDAATGALLAELPLPSPCFGDPVDQDPGARIAANAILDDAEADATGTAGWFRALMADGVTAVVDGSVTATGGGGDCQMASTSIDQGGAVKITSWTLTMPES